MKEVVVSGFVGFGLGAVVGVSVMLCLAIYWSR